MATKEGATSVEGATNEQQECECCADTFTMELRKRIQCPNSNCGYTACKTCVRTYLLSTTEAPHCMNCKVAWNQRFLVKHLNASFMNNDYKKHRKGLLTERQISMLPETMPALEEYHRQQEHFTKLDENTERIRELRKQIRELQVERNDMINAFEEGGSKGKDDEKDTKKFIMPCPDEHCRGFLSSAYKCGLCHYYACPKCLVITGKERNDPDHVCDEELVKTAALIRENSKPCPKCGERIMKASGCDQMWCIQCKTAFSWKTGKIETGIIHNPHFFQYQRDNQNQNIVRNPGDIVCGGLPNNWAQLRNGLRRVLMGSAVSIDKEQCACQEKVTHMNSDMNTKDNSRPSWFANTKINTMTYHEILIVKFTELFQTLRHYSGYTLPHYRRQVQAFQDCQQLRIDYLMKKIDRDEMGKQLIRDDRKRNKLTEMMHIYELFVTVGIDLINHLTGFYLENQPRTGVQHYQQTGRVICDEFIRKFDEFDTFVDYINEQLKNISVTYSIVVPQMTKHNYEFMGGAKFRKCDLQTSA